MVRVFVNSSGVDVPAGSTALDAVRTFDEELARDVDQSKRLITDSRGLPIEPTTPMVAGYIMRLVLNRAGTREAAHEQDEAEQ
ncbi:MAG TPA: hypothetical protein VGM82_19535 [Gemmatimonadaceae bacterium]